MCSAAFAQKSAAPVSSVWVADQGATYKNPILYADYSDPDACRVGDDFYMTSSSFNAAPGLPILHSKDLVNWELIGHALPRQVPIAHFETPQHGNGVWAPAIRHHDGEFYIYYPDPDFGIYVTKAQNPAGPWSDPILVEGGKGLIDPCPLWDDDGQVYLVHAYAGSRAGIKSVIVVKKMNPEGTKTLDTGVLVYDGHETDPTIEGPKFYKRNGYYYIFAPAGGVPTGWQLVLRSKNIYGPYERKVVMEQGRTDINGPHQGAWVDTPTGEDWFLHFQDQGPYGRVVHLNPMQWKNDWPVIGVDKDGDGTGEPVHTYQKPNVGKTYPKVTPPESDEFNDARLGLQWQWHANPQPYWAFPNPAKGVLRMYTMPVPDSVPNLWNVPNQLFQKFPAGVFQATTKLTFTHNPKLQNEEAGLVVMGYDYANLTVKSQEDGLHLMHGVAMDAEKGAPEKETEITRLKDPTVYLRVTVTPGAKCQFSYSTNGKRFTPVGDVFEASEGRWVGAKVGLMCTRQAQTNDAGYADFDWFRIEPVK
nr:glycoside hydrolase 43 family protein [Catalinimonas alkaloidigena]